MRSAKAISYSHCAQSAFGRGFVRIIETLTGRARLIKHAQDYASEITTTRSFWQVMADRYDLHLNISSGDLRHIPKRGPVVVVANHPFGILDGLMLGLILSRVRDDFRILANDVFQNAPEVDSAVLPVSFENSKDAVNANLDTRKRALEHLTAGGVLAVFPGGTVSTAAHPMGVPLDPEWGRFTARTITRSDAMVVPIFFEGRTSRMFQIASHLHINLRLSLLINEFCRGVGSTVNVVIGAPISPDDLAKYKGNPSKMMDFLRASTYELSPTPIDASTYGFDFDLWEKTAH